MVSHRYAQFVMRLYIHTKTNYAFKKKEINLCTLQKS